MSYPDGAVPTTERVHPTPIYELVLYVGDLRRLSGASAAVVCRTATLLAPVPALRGAARLAVEFLRRNPAWLLGLTTAQWFSLASIGIGVYPSGTRGRRRRKPGKRPDSTGDPAGGGL